ncbi:MAG: hypothetical protein GQ574_12830 [Crocinitomix sp.]|nr:hypothetical protein [Crocinitomix sp.]
MKSLFQSIFLAFSVLLCFNSFSQGTTELWTHIDRSNEGSAVMDLESDEQGNIYLLCNTFDTLWAETLTGTEIITSAYNNTYFIEKLDPFGNLLWVKNLSLEKDLSSPKINVNKKGEIILHLAVHKGGRGKDYYIRQYNADGELIRSKRIIKDMYYDNRCEIERLIVGDDNSICLIGSFYNYVIINGESDTLHNSDEYGIDNFILKLSSTGEYEWACKIKGSDNERITQLAMGENGDIFFAGYYEGEFIIEDDTLKLERNVSNIVFGKLNANGEKEFIKTFKGKRNGNVSSLKLDDYGNVMLSGTISGEYNIEDDTLGFKGRWDEVVTFMAKYNSELALTWFKALPHTRVRGGGEIYFGKENTIYWLGAFRAGLDFDPSNKIMAFPILETDRNGDYRMAIQKLDENGDFLDLYLFLEPIIKTNKIRILDYQTILQGENSSLNQTNEPKLKGIYAKIETGLFEPQNPLTIRTCTNYYWTETGEIYTGSGTYTSIVKSKAGADSTLELKLTIESIDMSLRKDEKQIYSNAKDVTFQWLDCENNYKPIRGETDSIFQFRETGTYSLEITSKYCAIVDTSDCISVEMIGIHPSDKRVYYAINYDVMIDKIEREHIQLDANKVKMIPFRDGPLYGFVKNGKKDKCLIQPRFEQVLAVYEEGAIVKDTAKNFEYGLINKKGVYLIPPIFKNLLKENGVYHGINFVWGDSTLNRRGANTSHYAHSYFNEKGELLFSERAHRAESFYLEDYAWFRFGKTYYVYNKLGDLVKEFKVDRNKTFIGIADNKLLFNEETNRMVAYSITGEMDFNVHIRDQSKIYKLSPNLFGTLSSGYKYYFSDSLGKSKPYSSISVTFDFQQLDGEFFQQKQFIVNDSKHQKYGGINRNGDTLIEFKYSYIGPLINGYHYCRDTLNKPLFIDAMGEQLLLKDINIPSINYRNESLRLVQNYGFYDGLAINLKRPEWSDSLNEADPDGYHDWWVKSVCYYYYDTSGTEQVVLSDTIELAGNFSDGLAPALTKDKKLGFVDKKGNWVIQPKYEIAVAGAYPVPYLVVPCFSNGFAYIKSFKGYIDKEGNEYFTGERMQDHYDFSH